MTPRAYLLATAEAITAAHFLAGLIKTPFLALAIGLIACGQGLATQGGAAGRRRPHDDRGRAGDFRRHRDQRAFTLLFTLHGSLIMTAAAAAHRRRGPAHRLGIARADGARHVRGRARHDLRDPRRLGLRQEHAAAPPDRPRTAPGGSHRHRRRRRAAPLRGRAAVRRAVPVGRALQLHDARREPRAPAHHLDARPRTARARSRAGQARSRRPRPVRGAPAGRDLGRHEEARRHRTRA